MSIEQNIITLGQNEPLSKSEQRELLSKIIQRLLLSAFSRGDWNTAYRLSILDIDGMIQQRSSNEIHSKLSMCLLRDSTLSESLPDPEF